MSEQQNNTRPAVVGRVPPHGEPGATCDVHQPATASGDAAYNATRPANVVRRVPPRGEPGAMPTNAGLGKHNANAGSDAGLGNPAYNAASAVNEPPLRRLRRLHRVWPDRDGNISYLLTLCVEGRARVLNNEATFQRLAAFLLDSPARYQWFPRRFVVMPDHLHLIAHQGHAAVRLGQWIKALKAVVGGLKCREDMAAPERPVGAPGLQDAPAIVGRVPSRGGVVGAVAPARPVESPNAASGDAAYNATRPADVGRVPPHGVLAPPSTGHDFTRLNRVWRWQEGFHDHKFRTPESEQRKWEYACLNPVRAGLVERPEQWPFGGEIFYDEPGGPCLVRGTPPLLEAGILIEEGEPPPGGGVELQDEFFLPQIERDLDYTETA